MIYAAQNKNLTERLGSSSGAIFPLLAKKNIEDGGIVCGAIFDKEFNVVHKVVKDSFELPSLYGSKYAFSSLGDIFSIVKEELEAGQKVLFAGSPCQVAGLNIFLRKDYPNLLALDFVCHGCPSNQTWRQYLNEISTGRQITNINFRFKKDSWQHYKFKIEYADGSYYDVDHDKDLYMRGFIDNLILRESCYHCKCKGLDRKSDITLGDAWGVWNFKPELFDDKGTSLLMINSPKGEQAIEAVADNIFISKINEAEAIKYNPAIVSAAKPNAFRQMFLNDYKKSNNLTASLKKYVYPSFGLKVYRKIYNYTHKG